MRFMVDLREKLIKKFAFITLTTPTVTYELRESLLNILNFNIRKYDMLWSIFCMMMLKVFPWIVYGSMDQNLVSSFQYPV